MYFTTQLTFLCFSRNGLLINSTSKLRNRITLDSPVDQNTWLAQIEKKKKNKNEEIAQVLSLFLQREYSFEHLLPRSIFLLLNPRKKAAIQQAEEVDIEKLITDWDVSEVGHLNNRPDASLQN